MQPNLFILNLHSIQLFALHQQTRGLFKQTYVVLMQILVVLSASQHRHIIYSSSDWLTITWPKNKTLSSRSYTNRSTAIWMDENTNKQLSPGIIDLIDLYQLNIQFFIWALKEEVKQSKIFFFFFSDFKCLTRGKIQGQRGLWVLRDRMTT